MCLYSDHENPRVWEMDAFFLAWNSEILSIEFWIVTGDEKGRGQVAVR